MPRLVDGTLGCCVRTFLPVQTPPVHLPQPQHLCLCLLPPSTTSAISTLTHRKGSSVLKLRALRPGWPGESLGFGKLVPFGLTVSVGTHVLQLDCSLSIHVISGRQPTLSLRAGALKANWRPAHPRCADSVPFTRHTDGARVGPLVLGEWSREWLAVRLRASDPFAFPCPTAIGKRKLGR